MSLPLAVAMGLRVLHEADAWDDELVLGACDWLDAVATPEGGDDVRRSSLEGWPHAPWWQVQPGLPPSMISAGVIAGVLLARPVKHPWLERTVEWLRETAPTANSPYTLYGALAFAEHEPRLADRLAPAIRRVVTLDPDAEGEVHGPLGFAPRPDSAARSRFDPVDIERHLDHLENGQREDGGWTFTSQPGRRPRRTTGAACSRLTRSSRCATTGAQFASSFRGGAGVHSTSNPAETSRLAVVGTHTVLGTTRLARSRGFDALSAEDPRTRVTQRIVGPTTDHVRGSLHQPAGRRIDRAGRAALWSASWPTKLRSRAAICSSGSNPWRIANKLA